ncbi:MAG: Fe-S cluster assembly protein SufD [Tepidisphaeraceae bacterium]
MTQTATPRRPVYAQLPAAPAWVEALRTQAQRRFDDVGYPTSEKIEAWRFTNLRPITETQWKPAQPDDAGAKPLFEKARFGAEKAVEIVLTNGHYSTALTDLANLPKGLVVQPLSEAVKGEDAELVRQYLGTRAKVEKNPFVALNQAHLNGGVFIRVKAGAVLEKPIHVVCVATTPDTISHPRILVIIEDAAQATIVQSYVGAEGAKYFTNAVAEVVVGIDAIVDHYKLNQESRSAYHLAALETIIGTASQFIDHNAVIGGKLSRTDIGVKLNGERSYSVLNGLVMVNEDQHADNHTLLEHAYPNCPSYELYKHVLDDKATCVFKGQIFVHQIAQKTDAKQASKTLLLSDDAQMNSQPALEIYADDVKCTHGSTTGPVDDASMFYLETRGLSREQAKQLLIYAFAADVTRRIKVEPVRERLEQFMAAQQGLPTDFRIQDLAGHDDDVVY